MKRSGPVRAIPAVLAALALWPAASAGQMSPQDQDIFDGPRRDVELLGAFGLITPLANLSENPESFGSTLKVNVAYMFDGVLWMTEHVGLGVNGVYSPSELQLVAGSFQGAVPNDLGGADYLAGTGQLLYRFRGSGSRGSLEPYLAVGGGLRRLSVDDIAAPEVVSSTDPVGMLAGGVRVEGLVPDMMIRVEIRDHMSFYETATTGESRLQNDVILTFGIGTRFH